jgi:hypothetical protein
VDVLLLYLDQETVGLGYGPEDYGSEVVQPIAQMLLLVSVKALHHLFREVVLADRHQSLLQLRLVRWNVVCLLDAHVRI